jgi:hypothetical protein
MLRVLRWCRAVVCVCTRHSPAKGSSAPPGPSIARFQDAHQFQDAHMTRQEAISKLQDLRAHADGSNPHVLADDIICDFLEALGFGDVVLQFRNVQEAYPVVTPKSAPDRK